MTRIISIVGGMQPSAPTIGTATAGDASASVAFTASSYIGKGTITYTATSSPGGFTGTGASSPITVSGLTNGTAYTFTVVGNTNYGVASVASAASNSVSPVAPVVGDWESIATQTITNTGATAASNVTNTISFTSIPSTYKHLRIECLMKDTWSNSGFGEAYLYFNSISGDTSAHHWTTITNTSASSSYLFNRSDGIFFGVEPRNQDANAFGAAIVDIYEYTDTGKAKVVKTLAGAEWGASAALQLQSGVALNTTTISSILIYPNGMGFQYRSTFALYGMKG
jgi:hypothetical protein